MEIGEVEGEFEGSDDQIDGLREAQGIREEMKGQHIKEDRRNSPGERHEESEKEEAGIGVQQLSRQGAPSETLPDTFGPCRSCCRRGR